LHPEVESKFELLPNGFDPRLLAMRAPRERRGRATLIHAGTLYGDRTAVNLLNALDRRDLRDRVRVELVGALDAATRDAIAVVAPRLEVIAMPPTSWEHAVERTRRADIAVVINGIATGGDMALPSKLFEALALGVPVLAMTSPESDTARLLGNLGQRSGCVAPDDVDGIANAVTRLLDNPPTAVDPQSLRPWDRSVVAEDVVDLLDRLCRYA
jgi:glycosyltransferase involved in cell wall biosynthesis